MIIVDVIWYLIFAKIDCYNGMIKNRAAFSITVQLHFFKINQEIYFSTHKTGTIFSSSFLFSLNHAYPKLQHWKKI